jgi:hypothetical protein
MDEVLEPRDALLGPTPKLKEERHVPLLEGRRKIQFQHYQIQFSPPKNLLSGLSLSIALYCAPTTRQSEPVPGDMFRSGKEREAEPVNSQMTHRRRCQPELSQA